MYMCLTDVKFLEPGVELSFTEDIEMEGEEFLHVSIDLAFFLRNITSCCSNQYIFVSLRSVAFFTRTSET